MTAEIAEPIRVLASADPARLIALRQEWSELFDAAGAPTPFLSWEWLFTWWSVFGHRRRLWILEARDPAGRLSGLLVLCARPGLGMRRFGLLGNGVTGADDLDMLVRPDVADAVRTALANALCRGLGDWDALDLEDLPAGSATVEALRSASSPLRIHLELERRFVCPDFALQGTFQERLRNNPRHETFGRRKRWLERQSGYRIEVAMRPEEVESAMIDFLRLHRLRWQAEGGSYGIPPGAGERFHREVAPRLAERGWLRLYRLFLGEQAVASVYGIEVGGRFIFYQSGFDPAWSARSPGVVLLGRTIEDAYAHGLSAYDFLRGTESYKFDWGSDRRETCAVRLRAPRLRAEAGALAEETLRAIRSLARAVVPHRIWGGLQRVRRGLTVNGLAR